MLARRQRERGIIRFNPNVADRLANRHRIVRGFIRFIELLCRPLTTFAGLGTAAGVAAALVAGGPAGLIVGSAAAGVWVVAAAGAAASEVRIIEPSAWAIKQFNLHKANGSWHPASNIMEAVFARDDLLVICDPSANNNHVYRHEYGQPVPLDFDQTKLVLAESKWERQMLVLRSWQTADFSSPTARLQLYRAVNGELYTNKQPPLFFDRFTGGIRLEESSMTMEYMNSTYTMYRAGGGSPSGAGLTGCAASYLADADCIGHRWCNAIYGNTINTASRPRFKDLDPPTVLSGMLVWFTNVSEFLVMANHFTTVADFHKVQDTDTDDNVKSEALRSQTHMGHVGFQNGEGRRSFNLSRDSRVVVAMHGAQHGTFVDRITWG